MQFLKIHKANFHEALSAYKEGIETGMATFETEVPSWEKWNQKFHPFSVIGLEENEKLVGWAALSPTSSRYVYKGVAEVSIYIRTEFQGKGFGSKLLEKLINLSEANGIWTLQANIFSDNTKSIQLHQKHGFRIVGIREKIGCLHGNWKDNTLLERRSKTIGI
ncbi:phosphinothricin acetyltransferase [Pustulibacterium marinum]|uniref:Phosphinothricin acetyltransferase n=1 Tax=Pustulibacterium marinum TaxID=1224947 RepID=A0A1I7F9N9_9FLAO|nr:GNAT family N-acetyltransferase [Pustulibacterium marinum]SFU32835.1 phosphinothricin acetyltransferase [Pustulibacterium marinum]